MEDFPKEYEDVFTSHRTTKKCKLKNVSTGDDDFSTGEYITMMADEMKAFQTDLFDRLVKIFWLIDKYHYMGRNRRFSSGGQGITLDGSFSVFTRFHVGYNMRGITGTPYYTKIAGYFSDFFPDFHVNNPFEVKYEYPYEHVHLDYLWMVHAMPERMELLQRAEEKKLSYSQFLDYVINYISVYNERYGDTFEFIYSMVCLPYIKYKKDGDKKIKAGDVCEQ